MSKWITVQVLRSDREEAQRLARQIARRGWGAVGANRSDAVTLGAVVGEGLKLLDAKLRAGAREEP